MKIELNHIGWFALRHKDGWWVGTSKGVICYEDILVAKVALTVRWQQDGGLALNYRIAPFTGANVDAGTYTPVKTAEQAIADYEAKGNRHEQN